MVRQAFGISLVLWVITGLVYPAVTTVVARALFPHQATGSLIVDADGTVRGSYLIAQPYAGDGWFHPRPPAGEAYDPLDTGGTNLAVARPDYQAEVLRRMDAVRKEAGDPALPVPADLVTASGSGLDPDLSLPAARAQVPRVSRATGIPEAELLALIDRVALPRELGLFGEPRVNVNVLNEALRALLAGRR
ncbi:potassium-transporting ATPase subunit KdpC [Hydrogenibacillus sp. N12]|uniref:potassium-transporting ATPase subunit KdpC n=1 Tax=Hydrogenibacillus sp. N12 TaxID=2866627 RepID=UPI001C7CADC1|nr:potassium-transporting ATPase subunit KdpC [Hydrogenibacillus sp. N12]QZA33187.1 potassium-transporting ATPase subunit KdpC [Hydrogenibacillus sp. N12]